MKLELTGHTHEYYQHAYLSLEKAILYRWKWIVYKRSTDKYLTVYNVYILADEHVLFKAIKYE